MLDPACTSIPVPPKRPQTLTHHGDSRVDSFHWLKDEAYPEVKDEAILSYLREENAYTEAVLEPVQPLISEIFEEIKGRLPADDESVPWVINGFEYRWTFASGAQYRCWWRRQCGEQDWQLVLDEAKEAKGKPFFTLGDFVISPDTRFLAYSADISGGERYDIFLRDLAADTPDKTIATNRSSGITFDKEGHHIISTEVSPEWRPFRVIATRIEDTTDHIIHEEKDSGFFLSAGASSDRSKLILTAGDHVTTEIWTLPLDAVTTAPLTQLTPRTPGVYQSADHDEEGYLIRSNRDHENFGLYRMASDGSFTSILMGDNSLYITGFQPFREGLAIAYKKDGMDRVALRKKGTDIFQDIEFADKACEVGLGHNPGFDSETVRFAYSSMTVPPSVYDVRFETGEKELKKQQAIPDGYDLSTLVSEQMLITARDGEKIPVSIVYRNDWAKGGKLHLYGYGAYGLGMTPSFSASRLSLLDRGFAFAIAHIRGGDEKGYAWYTAGKLEKRTNTFNDFVDVTRGLIAKGYCEPGAVTISGGSAGGELMGAVLNQAKELYAAAVLHVPFVDVLNTMLDESLPLTPMEWPEWGNPIADKAAYDLIKSYCPYTNLQKGDWPALFVTGGLADPRVTYWEPAKYVAKLRGLKTTNSVLLLKINMEAGHKGKSGRYDRYKETAEEYAFLLSARVEDQFSQVLY